MYAVCVTFTIKPGMMDAFMPLMQQQARLSMELESQCQQFDVCTDPDKPDQVFLYEIYDDAEAFQVHLASEHFKQFDGDVQTMIAEKTVGLFSTVFRR